MDERSRALQPLAGLDVRRVAQQDAAEEIGGLPPLAPPEKRAPPDQEGADRVRVRRYQGPKVLTWNAIIMGKSARRFKGKN